MVTASPEGKEQDFEINLASIIDCFVVLITYLLVSASFISLGIFDVVVTPSTASDEASQAPLVLEVSVDVDEAKRFVIKTTGRETTSVTINPRSSEWDFSGLTGVLQDLKTKFPDLNSVVLTAGKGVEYSDIVRAIEEIRKTIPAIALGDREQT